MTLSQEFKDYKKMMDKVNVTASVLDTLDGGGYTITMTENRFTLGSRKAFPKKPQETIMENITARQYACYISSIGFFKDRVTQGNTPAGYIPTRLTCKNPDGTLKIERNFKIVYTPPTHKTFILEPEDYRHLTDAIRASENE